MMECRRSERLSHPDAESRMLSEAFPGIRSSVRIRTTSESSAVSTSTSTRTATTHHHRCDLLHPVGGPQRPTQGEEDLATPPLKGAGGGGGGAKGGNNHVDLLLDPGPRSRTGSKGIRDFLRLVTRSSVADDGDRKGANGCHGDGYHGNGGGHVVTPPSRLSQLRDSMRQRSRSDADSMRRPRKRSPCPHAPTPTPTPAGEGELAEERGGDPIGDGWGRGCCDPKSHRHQEALTNTLLRVSGIAVSNGDAAVNPILSPLSPLGRVKTPNHIGPAEFIELYRHRAHSDPRPQVRMAALANVRRKKPPAARLASSPAYVAMDSLQEKKLILWKDKKDGNQLLVLPGNDSDDATIESIKLDRRVQLTYCELLRATKCYDIIPSSTKMVILDSQLSVKKALYALLNNGIRSAPLWDSQAQQLSGMLTVTDFILVLQRYYLSQPESVESLEDESISAFKAIVGSTVGQLTSIQPEENLLDAIFALRHHAVHRLPVIDPSTGNIIYMMTYKRLLHFLQTAISKNAAPFINETIDELKIGSYDDIATVTLESSVIDALQLLVDRRVSSLPVLDSHRKLVSMFSRADVINMAADKTYSRLDATIGETDHGGEPMFCVDSTTTCQKTDTLMSVVTKLSRREIHRLPVLDASGHVIGVVSVSDVVRFIAKQTEVH